MKVNLCNTSDHLLHSNSQTPQLIPMGQYIQLLMYWTTAHLVAISMKVKQQWDLGIQAPNINTNWYTLFMTEHNPSDFAVHTSGGNGLADLSFLNESTMATALTMDMTTVVTATGTIPTTAATPTTSGGALSSVAPSNTSGSRVGDRIIQMIDHMTLNINQPQYDFDAPDQHKEFRVLKQQLTSWFILWQIWEFQALPAILSCLGRKGIQHPWWMVCRCSHEEGLACILTTLWIYPWYRSRSQSLHVWLRSYPEKERQTAEELVACICQMAARAHIGNGSAAAIEFKVQCRFIRAITDDEIELR